VASENDKIVEIAREGRVLLKSFELGWAQWKIKEIQIEVGKDEESYN